MPSTSTNDKIVQYLHEAQAMELASFARCRRMPR
jgi:hypothetical protein